MTHIRTKALGLLIGLAAILTPASSLFAQEDAQSRFDQGMAAYHAGDHETALGHFRSVVSAMPDSVVAVELLHSSQDGILELLVAGGEFETFAREVLATAATMTNDVIRDSAAAEADAKGCFAESYETRARAIFALSSKYGPFAAPPLVAKLASPSEEIRLQAVYALSRLGTEAVLPTLAASHSSHVEVRMGALMVMAEIKDGRVAARVADMAENDTDGAVRSIAGQLGYTERAVDLHYAQAWNYILADEMLGLSPAENYGVLWSIDSSRLQSYSVPTSAMALELAKYHLIRADELGHPKAMSSLAVVYANEAALLQGLVNDGQDYQEVLAAQRNAALTISGADRGIAMQGALQHGMQAASIELASMLGEPGCPSTGLKKAMYSQWPAVWSAAALVLAERGDQSTEVLEALTLAMGLRSVRVVHVIDADSSRTDALAIELAKLGVTTVVSPSAGMGLVAMHRSVKVDAFVISNRQVGMDARRIVSEIRADSRHSDVPVFVLGENNADSAQTVELADASEVVIAFLELDQGRADLDLFAARATTALASIAKDNGALLSAHTDAFVSALARVDGVATPAATALGFIAAPYTVDALTTVVSDTSRSSSVRSAAARSLAQLGARGVSLNSDVLQEAVREGDAALSRACSSALGAVAAAHMPAVVLAAE